MLTTKQNPFSPFDEVSQWYLYDVEKGYNTFAIIGRMYDLLGIATDDLSYIEENEINELIIDLIIASNINDQYIKVYQDNDYYKESLPNES